MKTLAISLLRLGDLLCHAHVLRTLAEQRPGEITLLTHPFYQSIDFLFPFIDSVHIFEREKCQQSIGEKHFNKIWAFEHIDAILKTLRAKPFDCIVDLTQTDTSARWMTFLLAPEKIGVQYDQRLQRKHFSSENRFIKYLHSTPRSEFNFIDIYKRSLGLLPSPLPRAESINKREPTILFQTLTSDPKKNWPLENWKKVIEEISSNCPHYQLVVLASPQERQILEQAFQGQVKQCQIVTTTLAETCAWLKRASLLVSGDTAIKHLATLTSTPIIEIAVGSSNAKETGAYQDQAWIISASAPCSPCRHSQNCSMPSYLCHESITPDLVTKAILSKLEQMTTGSFSQANKSLLNKIQLVHQSADGWWALQPLSESLEEKHNARRHQESDQKFG